MNNNEPRYSIEIAKQLIFDCAMELHYGTEGLTNEHIAAKLLSVIEELDKMNFLSKK